MLPLAFLIVRGRFGRALRAVRDSEIASTANGVSTAALKTAAFGISAFYCGVAGALFGIGITYVNPDTFPIELSILLLVGIVIGGAGSIYGMLFGALFVEFIQISWGPALLEQSRASTTSTRGRRARAWSSTAPCCSPSSTSPRPGPRARRAASSSRSPSSASLSAPRIVEPQARSPQATPHKEKKTHEKDVPAARRSARRLGRRRRDGRRDVVGDAGRYREVDPARGHVPPQRAGLGLRAHPGRHGRLLLVHEREARPLRPADRVQVRGRRLQPGQHGSAHAQVRRAGSRVRARRRARDRASDGGAPVPEQRKVPQLFVSTGATTFDRDFTTLSVDARLAARLRGRRLDLRQVHRQEPPDREARRALPERRLRQRLPPRAEGGPHGPAPDADHRCRAVRPERHDAAVGADRRS